MSLAALLIAATAATTAPSPEALDLARQVAAHGVLATIAPIQTESEIEEMIVDHPELDAAQQSRLRAIGQEQSQALVARAVEAEAAAMAATLSLEDLRALATFARSPAAERQRAALPRTIGTTLEQLGDVDFGDGVEAAFCRETGKLCDD